MLAWQPGMPMNPRSTGSGTPKNLSASTRAGRYCLICTKPFAEWQLARMSGQRGVPPTPVAGAFFTSREDAEWQVFRRRWQELTGEDIN